MLTQELLDVVEVAWLGYSVVMGPVREFLEDFDIGPTDVVELAHVGCPMMRSACKRLRAFSIDTYGTISSFDPLRKRIGILGVTCGSISSLGQY